jgi:phage-related protein (TIGR01555 family)
MRDIKAEAYADAAGAGVEPATLPSPHWMAEYMRGDAASLTRGDSWVNILTGAGTQQHDKRMAGYFRSTVITEEQGRELWRGDPMGARIVESIVDEMLRKPFKLCVPDDAEGNDENYGRELARDVSRAWKRLKLTKKLHESLCTERACNGSVILIGVDDGAQSLADPVDESRIKAVNYLTVLEAREVMPVEWNMDARSEGFGEVSVYQINPISVGAGKPGEQLPDNFIRVHASRLAVFGGIRVSRTNQWGTFNGFGDNVFTRVFNVLRDFNGAFDGMSSLVNDFGARVFKIKDLAQIIADDNKQLFQARMQALALAMSTIRAAIIDEDESIERQTIPMTGLAEAIEQICSLVAMAANTPVPVLFGESPGGINASGASGDQLQMWRNRCEAERTEKALPPIEKITKYILIAEGGEPDEWSIEFEPLHSPTRKEEADTDKVVADTAVELMDRGVLTDAEVRRSPGFAQRWGITVADDPVPTAEPTAADIAAFKADPTKAVDPNAPAIAPTPGAVAPTGAPGAPEVAKQAMNGAQVTSLIEVITSAVSGTIPRESAQKILELAFQMTPADATLMLGPVNFEPKKEEPAPSPFGGGAPAPFPPKKAAPPFGDKPDAKAEDKPVEKE